MLSLSLVVAFISPGSLLFPTSTVAALGFSTALCFGPLRILECQRSKDPRTVLLKL